MIKYNSNIIWRKIRQCSIIFGHEFESELKKTGGNDLIKVAGQIEVQETIFTWYPAKPSESPECSSCSSDIEQFDEKNKCLCPFCVHPLCASLCRFSCISIVSACGEFKSPADFCILYSIFFSTLCVLFGIYSSELLSSINSEFDKKKYLNYKIWKLLSRAGFSV